MHTKVHIAPDAPGCPETGGYNRLNLPWTFDQICTTVENFDTTIYTVVLCKNKKKISVD